MANDPVALNDPNIVEFLQRHTLVGHAPLVPEIALYLATDVLTLWQRTETTSGGKMPPPYWGFAWPGGQALARYILDHPQEVAQKFVLDFGSGCGLLALAAARARARHVDAAEIDPIAQAAILRNAAGNDLTVTILRENIIGRDDGWETILVGDMCYERPLAEALTAWLKTLSGRGARVLLGDPGRNYFLPENMESLARYDVPTLLDLEDKPMRTTGVYALARA